MTTLDTANSAKVRAIANEIGLDPANRLVVFGAIEYAMLHHGLQFAPAPARASDDFRIGDPVQIVGEYEAHWRGVDLWVTGICIADNGTDLNITVGEQWPVPNRHASGYLGMTDDFRPWQLARRSAVESGASDAVIEAIANGKEKG